LSKDLWDGEGGDNSNNVSVAVVVTRQAQHLGESWRHGKPEMLKGKNKLKQTVCKKKT
jgi:hypothetical protein